MINRHLLGASSVGLNNMSDDSGDHHFRPGEDFFDAPVEKLLEPSRISIAYDNLVKDAGLFTNMSASVYVEPFEIKVGFREVDFFKTIEKSATDFLNSFKKPDSQEERESVRFKSKRATNQTEIDIDRKLL
jgi:hypothetical protein